MVRAVRVSAHQSFLTILDGTPLRVSLFCPCVCLFLFAGVGGAYVYALAALLGRQAMVGRRGEREVESCVWMPSRFIDAWDLLVPIGVE